MRKENVIFPIGLSKNFVGKSKMENVKTILVLYCYFENYLLPYESKYQRLREMFTKPEKNQGFLFVIYDFS